MNEYDEDKWSAEQRALDGRIALEFEGLEGSRATYEATGAPLEAWLAGAADSAKALRAQIARLTHAGRKAHWDVELARIGLPRPAEPKPAPIELPKPNATMRTESKGGAGKNG